MAASKPVIASSAGGAAEIVSDGVDGLLTPPGDSAALAHALARLLADPAECIRIGQAGRRTVEQRYQIGAHVAAIQSFYGQVLSNKG
jgi:glycosyltransferase involved in cell wall biosynthesis